MTSWVQATIKVSGNDITIALETFDKLEALAVTQQNAGEDDFYDLAHPAEPGWRKQEIVALFAEGIDEAQIAKTIADQLPENDSLIISALADQDWESAWIDQYQPTRINERLWVYPSWSEIDPKHEVVVKIDPGLAFGTGTHPTTALCLNRLSELDLAGQTVMDYGCGSGILGIGALLMGAQSAVGIDIDPQAETVSIENAEINGVADRFTIQSARQKTDSLYAVVIANILAGALIDLRQVISGLVAPEGHLLLSGVLKTQAEEVKEAYSDEFDLTLDYDEEWVLLTGVKKATGCP